MKKIISFLSLFFCITIVFSQTLHQAESFQLNEPVTGNHIFEASKYIQLLQPGFQYIPQPNEAFIGKVDPYLVLPPEGGETGGPGGLVGNDGIVGATDGNFSVSDIGASIYTIPIKCMLGIAGMQPSISLTYNSSGPDGFMGPGWALNGISEIMRTNERKERIGGFSEFDSFVLDGVRLIGNGYLHGDHSDDTERSFFTEKEDFSKITMYIPNGAYHLSYFVVQTKSGLIYTYGGTDNSRRTCSTGKMIHKPISYLISKIEDLNGNAILFSYTKDAETGECYPIKIEYTINEKNSVNWADYSIEFGYEPRNNKLVNRYWGNDGPIDRPLEYTVAHRLRDIAVKWHGNTVRNYHLEYTARGPADNPEFQNMYLESIQETGIDGIKYNKTVFNLEPEPATLDYKLVSKTIEYVWDEEITDYYVDLDAEGGKELILFDPDPKIRSLQIYKLQEINGQYSLQLACSHYAGVRDNMSFGDFNGDGMTDIIMWYINDDNFWVYDLWESTSDNENISFNIHYSVLAQPTFDAPCLTYFGEYNGDGKTDLMMRRFMSTTSSSCEFYFYWNEDNKFHEKSPSSQSVYSYDVISIDATVSLVQADMNGDGRTDYFCHKPKDDYYPAEQGFLFIYPNLAVSNEIIPITKISDSPPAVISDFNGDGKTDALFSETTKDGLVTTYHLKIYQSTGRELVAPTSEYTFTVELPPNETNISYQHEKIQIKAGEFNLDGHTDILAIIGTSKHVMTGTVPIRYFSQSTKAFISNSTGNKLLLHALNYNQIPETDLRTRNRYSLEDLNGDGKSDLITVNKLVNNTQTTWDQYQIDLNIFNDMDGNKINNITNGLGIKTKIKYKYLTDERSYPDKGEWPVMSCNLPLSLVDTVSTDNGFGGLDIMQYTYEKLRIHPKDGILGFMKTSSFDLKRKILKETVNKLIGFNDFAFNGEYSELNKKLYRILPDVSKNNYEISGSFKPFSETNYIYDIKTHNVWNSQYSYFLYVSEQTDKLFENDGSLTKVSKTINGDLDDYGNFNSITVKHGTSETDLPYEEITKCKYSNYIKNDINKWLLGRLSEAIVTKKIPGATDISRKSTFTYYNLDGENGQIKKETVEPDDLGKAVIKTYVYDDFGNISTTTLSTPGKTDRITQTNYDHNLSMQRGRFLTQMINAMNYSSEKEVDPMTGNTLSATDLNGLKTSYSYDGFGTKIKTILPDKTNAIVTARWCDQDDPDLPQFAAYYIWSGSSAQMPVKKYYSTLGKELRMVTFSFDGKKIYNDVAYDYLGRQWKSFLPYFADQPPSPGQEKFTETKYDEFNRVKQVINPDITQSTQYTYQGLKTSVTNAKGQTTSATYNAAGWLLKSTDANGQSVVNEYYSDGKVSKKYVEGKSKTTISFEYDLYGNVKKMTDPDLGTISYTYTGFGELETDTNNRQQATSYVYDNLGRVISRTDDKQTLWTYDTGEHGIGLISSMSIGSPGSGNYDQQVNYAYDDLSRPSRVDEIIDNITYSTSTTYDIFGRPDQIIYPSTNYTIKHHYNEFGFFDKVMQSSDDKVLWQATAYNEKGQLLQSSSGSHITTSKEYDPLTGSLTAIRSGALQNFEYDFDAIGNLNWRKDLQRNMKERFEYDNLNRLSKVFWNQENIPKLSMAYDEIGNITYKSDVGNYSYDTEKLHKLVSIDNKPVTVSEFDQNIEYNWFDKVSKVWLNDGTKQTRSELLLTYGVDRQRIKQVISKNGIPTTRIYVGGLYEKYIDGDTTEEIHYISGGDGLIAIFTKKNNDSSLAYVLKDHLGSIQLLVNEDNSIEQELSYDAWGLRRDPVTWNTLSNNSGSAFTRGFTGHEHLDLFALINMNGRMYDPVLGYFTSPDPVIQYADYTQGLNRYSYCMNNPLSMIDPTGHSIASTIAVIAVAVAVSYFTGGLAATATAEILASSALLAGAAAGFTGALIASVANGCSFQETLVNVFFGTITGAIAGVVTCGIGEAFLPLAHVPGTPVNLLNIVGTFGKAAAHGLRGGLFSMMQGGKFEQGFFTAAAASFGGDLNAGQDDASQITLGAVVGGTVEEIGGGKFANGAVTGAFTALFNAVMHKIANSPQVISEKDLDDLRYNGRFFNSEDEAAAMAKGITSQTECETQIFKLTSSAGESSYYLDPYDNSTETSCNWIDNDCLRRQGFTINSETHYSIASPTGSDPATNHYVVSMKDFQVARSLHIPVTHYSIGFGQWHIDNLGLGSRFVPMDLNYFNNMNKISAFQFNYFNAR
jgi:RHS repeat-associated protein